MDIYLFRPPKSTLDPLDSFVLPKGCFYYFIALEVYTFYVVADSFFTTFGRRVALTSLFYSLYVTTHFLMRLSLVLLGPCEDEPPDTSHPMTFVCFEIVRAVRLPFIWVDALIFFLLSLL